MEDKPISKVRRCTVQPEWSRFPGFSLLMDNELGYRPLPSHPQLAEIDQGRETRPAIRLYRALESVVTALGSDLAAYGFCELPASSYHVTLLDGISVNSLAPVPPDRRADIERCLDRLPSSLSSELPAIVDTTPLEFSDTLRMRFSGLEIRDGHALVALLDPTEESKPLYDEVLRARSAVDESWSQATGRPAADGYMPHVSLGYFIDPDVTAGLVPRLGDWNELARRHAGDTSIGFKGASVYGFSDMVSFYKDIGRAVLSLECGPPTLPEAFAQAHLAGIPDSGRWMLSSQELTTIEECVRRSPTFVLEAKSFFIARHAVPTLSFTAFAPEALALKHAIDRLLRRLGRGNDGSKWAKVTLGALNDGRVLDHAEAGALLAIVHDFDRAIAETPWRLQIDQLSVVAFASRSLERRWATHRIALSPEREEDSLPLPPPAERQSHVERIDAALRASSAEGIVAGQAASGHRLSHYREPHSETTLVADLPDSGQPAWLGDFMGRVDEALPGHFSWFDTDSLHVTIRALMPE